MLEEMNAFKKNCKRVYTIKYNPDGTIRRLKAKLVSKGFTQSYGIDYIEAFSPVAKLNFVKVILSIVANLQWLI